MRVSIVVRIYAWYVVQIFYWFVFVRREKYPARSIKENPNMHD
jgi:hypothetical protein